MSSRVRRFATLVVVGLGLLAGSTRAHADFVIDVYIDGHLIDQITKNGGLDSPASANTINTNVDLLNADIANYGVGQYAGVSFSSLSLVSNFATATGNGSASLKTTGEVDFDPTMSSSPVSVTVVGFANNYHAPSSFYKLLSSSGSGTFTGTTPTDSHQFNAIFDATNSSAPLTNPQDPFVGYTGTAHTMAPPTFSPSTPPPASFSVNNTPLLVTGSGNFALINQTTLHIGSDTGDLSSIQFTNSTIVTHAVPEPGSLALVFLGLPVVARRVFRRRQATV